MTGRTQLGVSKDALKHLLFCIVCVCSPPKQAHQLDRKITNNPMNLAKHLWGELAHYQTIRGQRLADRTDNEVAEKNEDI